MLIPLDTIPFQVRRWIAGGAILMAVVASMATSPMSNFEEVNLPERGVEFTATTPVVVQRFRLSSNDGHCDIVLEVETATDASPYLRLASIEGTYATPLELSLVDSTEGANRVAQRYVVTADCPKEFPCILDFEVTAGSNVLGGGSVSGTLRVAARFTYAGDIHDRYLSIDSL